MIKSGPFHVYREKKMVNRGYFSHLLSTFKGDFGDYYPPFVFITIHNLFALSRLLQLGVLLVVFEVDSNKERRRDFTKLRYLMGEKKRTQTHKETIS